MRLAKRLARVERAAPPPPPPPDPPAPEADWPAVTAALLAIAAGDEGAADGLAGPTREALEELRPIAPPVAMYQRGLEDRACQQEEPR